MIKEAFLVCALSAPALHFNWPSLIPWSIAKSEEQRIKDFIHKNNPDADIFITPHGDTDRLRNHGWERVPFTWEDKEIWIQRKPKSDAKSLAIETSA